MQIEGKPIKAISLVDIARGLNLLYLSVNGLSLSKATKWIIPICNNSCFKSRNTKKSSKYDLSHMKILYSRFKPPDKASIIFIRNVYLFIQKLYFLHINEEI